jgi:protein TonB
LLPNHQPRPVTPVVTNPAPATFSPPRFEAAYLHNPRPNYPAVSRRLGEEGKVLLRVLVSPDGRAAAVNLEKSSNFERLDEAARQAVAQWRFVPAKRGDEAVEATIIIPLVFRLED